MYNNSQLFTNVRCSVMSDGVRVCEGGAVLVTPIIVVTTVMVDQDMSIYI